MGPRVLPATRYLIDQLPMPAWLEIHDGVLFLGEVIGALTYFLGRRRERG